MNYTYLTQFHPKTHQDILFFFFNQPRKMMSTITSKNFLSFLFPLFLKPYNIYHTSDTVWCNRTRKLLNNVFYALHFYSGEMYLSRYVPQCIIISGNRCQSKGIKCIKLQVHILYSHVRRRCRCTVILSLFFFFFFF